MAISHVFSNAQADATGTVTVWNGATTASVAATDLVRPSDWNSGHNQFYTLSGNTNNASTASGTNVVLSGGNNVTLIGSGSQIGFSVGNYITTGAQSDHSHGNPTLALTNVSGTTASASNGLTLSLSVRNNATMSAYAPPWAYSGRATNSSAGQNSLYFMPFDVYDDLYASRINFYLSHSGALSAGNSTGTCYYVVSYALYTLNSDSLNRLTSYGATVASQSMNSNTQYAATHYAGLSNATSHTTVQTALSTSNATTYQATNLNGQRVLALPVNSTLTPGRYYLAFANSTIAGNAMTNNWSVQMTSVGVQPDIRAFGQASAATNASVFRAPAVQGFGTYSATSGAFPQTIAYTTDNIRHGVAITQIHFDILGYSNNTNLM